MTEPEMRGKVCLVTGSSSGIGKETALGLARLGATVVMVCRDRARGEAARYEIASAGGGATVDLLLADLSSQAAIHSLAEELTSRYPRIDVLVNNAGALNTARRLTDDGIEMTFAVNHLAYFLLTNLLLDTLKASAPARIVNVASDSHTNAHINFDDLQGARRYRGMQAYGQSKLANILFTYELARRLQGSGVTANCLHPGVVATGFGHNNGRLISLGFRLIAPFVTKPDEGAKTSIYLASSPQVDGVSGKYFVKCKETRSSAASYDEAAARRLWDLSAELTHLDAATGKPV